MLGGTSCLPFTSLVALADGGFWHGFAPFGDRSFAKWRHWSIFLAQCGSVARKSGGHWKDLGGFCLLSQLRRMLHEKEYSFKISNGSSWLKLVSILSNTFLGT